IKQTDDPIREQIDEGLPAFVRARMRSRGRAFGVMERQGAAGAKQADECRRDDNAWRTCVVRRLDLQAFDFACRECQGKAVTKAQHLAECVGVWDALLAQHPHQDSHQLCKPISVRRGEQALDHDRDMLPLRGLHRHSTSPDWCDRTTSSIKLFIWTYSAKNW